VRALEVTHGANGWHPHLHAILLTRTILDPDALASIRADLSSRWRACVERTLGDAHVPTDERGVDLRPCHRGDYLSKLGLEVTAPVGKAARGENRSPLEIASDFASTGDFVDLSLWLAYVEGMKGARQLTWATGVRERYGLGDEATDESIVEGESPGRVPVLVLDPGAWREVVRAGKRLAVLEAAERGARSGGVPGACAAIDELLAPLLDPPDLPDLSADVDALLAQIPPADFDALIDSLPPADFDALLASLPDSFTP
jgi:hypothetical protein